MRGFATAVLALALVACADRKPHEEATQSPLERGKYIVERMAMCIDCHSPMTPTGPDPAKAMQGATLGFQPIAPIPNWETKAPKLAGLTTISREFVVRVLTEGLDDEGQHPHPPMPAYRMTKADAEAVATYLATLK
jgi:hypothetical protein